LARNKARDLVVARSLRKRGWRVLRIWEHELTRKNEMNVVRRICRALATDPTVPSPLVGLVFSALCMVAGSLVPRGRPQTQSAHGGHG